MAAGPLVGVLGFQEPKGIGQELITDRGRAGSVVAIEALDVARRELRVGDGGGQDLGVGRVGARHRNQALHRAVGRDLPGNDQSLDRRREHPDQVQPARDPALAPPQTKRDDVEAEASRIHQFLDEQRLLECGQRCTGLADANPEKRFGTRHRKNLRADEIPAETLERLDTPVPIDDHILPRRVSRDHDDRELLVVLLDRREEHTLCPPVTDSQVLVGRRAEPELQRDDLAGRHFAFSRSSPAATASRALALGSVEPRKLAIRSRARRRSSSRCWCGKRASSSRAATVVLGGAGTAVTGSWASVRTGSAGAATTSSSDGLECPKLAHFPEKWTPVFRRKCDQRKNLERVFDST